MTTNRSVPTNYPLPHVAYPSVVEATAWLTWVFGFNEHFRYGGEGGEPSGAQLLFGNAVIMLHSKPGQTTPVQLGYGTQSVTVFVNEVEEHFARAKAEGARIVEEPHETVYGERQYAAEDLAGHLWIFSRHSRDLSPAEWGATLAKR